MTNAPNSSRRQTQPLPPAPTHRTGRELDAAIVSMRQTIALLRSQAQSGRLDAAYVESRLQAADKLMEEISADRQESGHKARLAALYEVSRVIGSSLDLQTVLDQVMDAIIQLTGAERGFLMLLDDERNLDVRVARNFDQETLTSDSFAVSRTITRRVVDNGQAIVTTNAQEDPRFAGTQSVVTHALRSIMATPLRVRGQTIGVVYVDNRMRAGLFGPGDLEALDAFTGQASVAIDNARLFSATDKALAARVEELTMLQWIDRQLNETLDLPTMMNLTVEWSMRVCEAQGGMICLWNAEASRMQVTVLQGQADLPSVGTVIDVNSPLQAVIARAMDTQEAAFQEAAEGQPALFAAPIRRENQVVGVILLSSHTTDSFPPDAQSLVTRVAERAAIAIENGRLYEAVRGANNAKSEFVGLVAHELKVPMTSISGYADLLPIAGPVTDKQAQFIATIKNAVNRMRILVNDLNDISRIESGNLRIDLEPVSVREAINSALEGAQTEIERRGHQLSVTVPSDLPPVRADQDRLAQVLLNLISNAYKYTPDGGAIQVEAFRKADRIAFRVADTGIGMTAQQLANLGIKFWRAENALNQPGTGLGFAITNNLIQLMHGDLDVQSTPGKGSMFTFSLPAADNRA
ncbi:MAG: sensor histidine kinase [Aggregatilineales bacterium]